MNIKEFLGFEKPKYIITIEFNKFGDEKYIVRSHRHKGTKINNSFMQFIFEVNNKGSILDDVIEAVKKEFPNSSNHKITDIIKL